MKSIVLKTVLFVLFVNLLYAQNEPQNLEAINDYKYIVVPVKYEFLNDADKYQLNSLTKFLFNKYGYTAFLENDPFPEDLKENRCLALRSEVVKAKGGFLDNRVKINLVDCNGTIITVSKVGKSREKMYKVAYNLALREAFETFQTFDYTFKATDKTLTEKNTVNHIKPSDSAVIKKEIDLVKSSGNNETEKQSDVPFVEPERPIEVRLFEHVLVAHKISNGFELTNSNTDKVEFIIHVSTIPGVYIMKDTTGIIYQKGDKWVKESIESDKTIIEELTIKF